MRIRFFGNALTILTLLVSFEAASAEGAAETIKRLAESKHTLVDGMRQAEKANGVPISAKFEFEDGKLWLSVYTAKSGKAPDAEHNTLMELKGESNASEWRPNLEVFQDKEHIARSATQLTLIQLSRFSLEEAIKKASAEQKGTVYSAIPVVKAGKPVVEVLVATAEGKSAAVDVDLQTGRASKH